MKDSNYKNKKNLKTASTTLANAFEDDAPLKIGSSRKVISIKEIIPFIPRELLEKYVTLHDARSLVKIFGDSEIMATAESFFQNNLNVSQTAQTLYMHRNTLMYRLNKIKRLTGLDIKNFDMAITFEILSAIYKLNGSNNEIGNKK